MIPHLRLFYAKANKRFTDAINSYSRNILAEYIRVLKIINNVYRRLYLLRIGSNLCAANIFPFYLSVNFLKIYY